MLALDAAGAIFVVGVTALIVLAAAAIVGLVDRWHPTDAKLRRMRRRRPPRR